MKKYELWQILGHCGKSRNYKLMTGTKEECLSVLKRLRVSDKKDMCTCCGGYSGGLVVQDDCFILERNE